MAAASFDYSDVIGAWLVHVATDSPTVNASVADEAERRASGPFAPTPPADARTPAVATMDGVTVSVTTGDPGRSAVIRDAVALGLQDGTLASRPHRARAQGSVVLIGGGPGDSDLITVRGRRELLSADVIVFDRLAPTALLDLVDPDVELIDAGKSPGHHTLSQDEINAIIVDRARRGLRVARLKGGDPFVLGRGSEEVLACAEAGIAVEVVPGVTSAISGPAAAGIPVTHRGLSTGFVVVSGHALGDVSALASHRPHAGGADGSRQTDRARLCADRRGQGSGNPRRRRRAGLRRRPAGDHGEPGHDRSRSLRKWA